VSFAEAKGLAVIPSSCHDGVDYFIQAASEVTASCQCTRPCVSRLLMLAHPPESERMSSSEERFINCAFTLEISGIDTERENCEDALYEAGCDDALIAVVNGTVFLDFHRDASSLEDAVKSASRNVELAGGKVVRGRTNTTPD